MNTPPTNPSRRSALIALLLLLPMPTIGTILLLYVLPDIRGKILAFTLKAWILILPLWWWSKVDRRELKFPRPTWRGLPAGLISGIVIFIAMLVTFQLVKPLIPMEAVSAKAAETGFNRLPAFALMFVYIICVNSLLEEYVWRWFVFRKFEDLMPATKVGRAAAVVASGLAFTLHHIFAVTAWTPPAIAALASLGVFIGATTWSALYLHYRSIWPGFVSHLCADVAILIMGYELIFR